VEGLLNRRNRKRAETLLMRLAQVLGIAVDVTASERGRRLESYCASKCRAMGFDVIECGTKGKPYDLVINGHRVQCKSRKKHGHNGHGVNLFKNSQKKYLKSEVDFFVIRFNRQCFVIPSSDICDRDGRVFSWVRLTNKAHYVNAWHQLEGQVVLMDRQRCLFVEG
jgi:hypothetical protein